MTEVAIFNEFAKYGLLGIILAIIGWAYWRKDGELRSAWAARVDDSKLLTKVVETTNSAYAALAMSNENRTRASEAIASAAAATAQALEKQSQLLEKVVMEIQAQNRQTDDAIADMKRVQRNMEDLQSRLEGAVSRIVRVNNKGDPT